LFPATFVVWIGALDSSLDAAKRNQGCVKLGLSSIPLRYIEATCYMS